MRVDQNFVKLSPLWITENASREDEAPRASDVGALRERPRRRGRSLQTTAKKELTRNTTELGTRRPIKIQTKYHYIEGFLLFPKQSKCTLCHLSFWLTAQTDHERHEPDVGNTININSAKAMKTTSRCSTISDSFEKLEVLHFSQWGIFSAVKFPNFEFVLLVV